jgi:hypothetical protein
LRHCCIVVAHRCCSASLSLSLSLTEKENQRQPADDEITTTW